MSQASIEPELDTFSSEGQRASLVVIVGVLAVTAVMIFGLYRVFGPPAAVGAETADGADQGGAISGYSATLTPAPEGGAPAPNPSDSSTPTPTATPTPSPTKTISGEDEPDPIPVPPPPGEDDTPAPPDGDEPPADDDKLPTSVDVDAREQAVIDGINARRVTANCPVLVQPHEVSVAADLHTGAMVKTGVFSSNAGDGTPLKRVNAQGYGATVVEEAIGHGRDMDALRRDLATSQNDALVTDCSFTAVGIGIRDDGLGGLAMTVDLAR